MGEDASPQPPIVVWDEGGDEYALLFPTLAQAVAAQDAAARLSEVRALHRPVELRTGRTICNADRKFYPCPTILAIAEEGA